MIKNVSTIARVLIALGGFTFVAEGSPAPFPSDWGNSPASQSVSADVDWNTPVHAVDPMSYGVDCPAYFDPAWTHNPALLTALATLTGGGKPLIRLRGCGMVSLAYAISFVIVCRIPVAMLCRKRIFIKI